MKRYQVGRNSRVVSMMILAAAILVANAVGVLKLKKNLKIRLDAVVFLCLSGCSS